MRISIFGLGYVGCVSAACLASDGHEVIGVDVNPVKVASIAAGRSPIIEHGLEELLQRVVRQGQLRATIDARQAVFDSDVSLICVGTPSNPNGSLNTRYVESVCQEIGLAINQKGGYHTVVVRSTVLPGTVEEKVVPILEEFSGLGAGIDFGVAMNPEFLREGTAIADYYDPSFIVIGQFDDRSGDAIAEMYAEIDAKLIRTSIKTAEMMKYANNTFHALKISFANEIGNICKAHGIDGRDVMDIICQDDRLNISPAYLKPGFAFGGSCLPKDLRALMYRSKERDIESPLLSAIMTSNAQQVDRGVKMVERSGHKKVGILGLSFKAGTDDLRESSVVPLIETLVGRGFKVSVFDETVEIPRLIGANRTYIEGELPHIATLMRASIDEVLDESEVVVVANGGKSFRDIGSRIRPDQVLIDLVGAAAVNGNFRGEYEGICW
ncbi:MAG TPA: UDP-glucose/GDP-mannose dehydrogenase family protein [Nitrolancea sp.]|nr:UDP-glucose/GDP-mannose dehydrogenase family protein [Nitrolancea sp.]